MKAETLGVLTACLALLGSAAATQEWLWTGFIAVLLVALGIFEFIGVKLSGLTLTNRFREMQTKKKVTLTGGLVSFFLWLIYHLWLEK